MIGPSQKQRIEVSWQECVSILRAKSSAHLNGTIGLLRGTVKSRVVEDWISREKVRERQLKAAFIHKVAEASKDKISKLLGIQELLDSLYHRRARFGVRMEVVTAR